MTLNSLMHRVQRGTPLKLNATNFPEAIIMHVFSIKISSTYRYQKSHGNAEGDIHDSQNPRSLHYSLRGQVMRQLGHTYKRFFDR